jgi:multisubunit Na+/H+ antiporter MnhB subunit
MERQQASRRRLKRMVGVVLVLVGVAGLIATLLGLAYLLFVIVIWCPLSRCVPQFIVVVTVGALSCWAAALSLNRGSALLRR